MPHHSEDRRYPHLKLIRESVNPDRRKHRNTNTTKPPDRGGRATFADSLATQLAALAEEAAKSAIPSAGIQPHLVFRVPVAEGVSTQVLIDRLSEAGLDVVGVEPDNAIIAFRDDADLSSFENALEAYQILGLNQFGKPAATTKWDVFEYIEADQMRSLGPTDRIGRRLANRIGVDTGEIDPTQVYVLDVEVWHRGNRTFAQHGLNEVRCSSALATK